MKKSKGLLVLFIIFAIATFIGGVTTTVQAVSASIEYKQLDSGELVIMDNGATKEADKRTLIKSFSLSLLLFLAFAVCIIMIAMQVVRKKE